MKFIKLLIIVALVLQSCSKDDGGSGPAPIELGEFALTFPNNNEVCTEGTSVSAETVSIPFSWNASDNATSYQVEVTQSDNNQKFEASATNTNADIALPKGTQFTWKVTAIVDDKTKESDAVFSFYSQGATQDNHIPFPANITLTNNGDGTIDISWQGSDLDNDIIGYDVRLGTSDNLTTIASNTTETTLPNRTILFNTDYTLEVVTKDSEGNSSISKKQFNFKS